jgi:hypothetical protein
MEGRRRGNKAVGPFVGELLASVPVGRRSIPFVRPPLANQLAIHGMRYLAVAPLQNEHAAPHHHLLCFALVLLGPRHGTGRARVTRRTTRAASTPVDVSPQLNSHPLFALFPCYVRPAEAEPGRSSATTMAALFAEPPRLSLLLSLPF